MREAKGSKKVLLKNVMKAKYDGILVPIAEAVLPADELDRLSFEAFFQFVLHHELSHGLGPGLIEVDGRQTEVRLELRDLDSALEEAKARLSTLEKKLAEASTAVDAARAGLFPDMADQVEELERNRAVVLRRTMKARVRVESAQAEVDALSGS